jgi:hypothetical protein
MGKKTYTEALSETVARTPGSLEGTDAQREGKGEKAVKIMRG